MFKILGKDIKIPSRYYVYIYLDTRKPGLYKYDNFELNYEPFYVGKGKGNRAYQHFKKNKINKLKMNIINKIINETNNLPIIILYKDNLDEIEAFEIEKYLINLFGRRDLNTGSLANLTDGGEGLSGYRVSEEHKLKLSKLNKGNKFAENGRGKKTSKDVKEKISKSLMGNKNAVKNKLKKVMQFDLNDNLIKIWNNADQATKELRSEDCKVSAIGIREVCRNYRNAQTCGGFKWKYI